VITAAVLDAAHLDDPQLPTLGSEAGSGLVQRDDAVGDAVELKVAGLGGAIVEHENRTVAAREKVLEGQDLPSVAQGVLRQKAQLREAVEHDALGLEGVDPLHHPAHRLSELHLRRMQQGLLLIRIEAGLGNEFEQFERVQGPAVGLGNRTKLCFGFGQGDIETRFAEPDAFEQELQRKRRLARAGRPFHEIEAVCGDASAQNVVEAFDSCGGAMIFGGRNCGFVHYATFKIALPALVAAAMQDTRAYQR
jgi:hypothetical protein